MTSKQKIPGSPNQKLFLTHIKCFSSGNFVLPSNRSEQKVNETSQTARNSSIHKLTLKVYDLQDKLSNVCSKMKVLGTKKKLNRAKQPLALSNNYEDSNIPNPSNRKSELQVEELKKIESKIQIFTKRKEYLQNISSRIKSETLPSENISVITNIKLKDEVQFSCTYNENGHIIYEGEFRDGQYNGKGHLINEIYKKSNLNLLNCLDSLYLSQESDLWTSYNGQFRNGLFNGTGSLYLQYIYKINGTFKNGIAEGRITLINIQKQVI